MAAEQVHRAADLLGRRFEQLYKLFRPRLAGFLRACGAPLAVIDDLVQDVLMVAWRRMADVPNDNEGARRWLFSVAERVLANYRRGQHRRVRLVERYESHLRVAEGRLGWDPSGRLEAVETLASLSEHQRLLLLLRGWEGFDYPALGEVLGCSPEAAKARIFRARQQLATYSA